MQLARHAGYPRASAHSSARASMGSSRVAGQRGLDLMVLITGGGVVLKAAGGNVAPGCNGVGSGITVPKAGDDHDYKSLTTCAKRVKDANAAFKEETQVTIVPNSNTAFGTVISVMSALRSDATDGEVLFPDAHFGQLRDDSPRAQSVLHTGRAPHRVCSRQRPVLHQGPGRPRRHRRGVGPGGRGARCNGGRRRNVRGFPAVLPEGSRQGCQDEGIGPHHGQDRPQR